MAAAVLGAVMMLAGLLAVQLRDGSGSLALDGPTSTTPAVTATTAPAPATTATTAPAPTSGAGPTSTIDPNGVQPLACPPGVDPLICDAAAYVQQARERPFKTFPPVELLADAEFDQALLTDFEDVRADLDAEGVTLTALGLLDPAVSLADAYRDALEIGVVGFYDPATGRLVVRADAQGALGDINLYVRQVVVHELTHALDDQWFDLDRDDFADIDAEYGFSAAVEGNARRVDEQWQNQLDAASQVQLQADSLSALSPDDMVRYFSLPPVLQQLQLSPYTDGAEFMRAEVAAGGEAAADQLLVDPPQTSEEVLHPDRTRADDPEIILDGPTPGGAEVTSGRLGERIVDLWLGTRTGDGWGGDRYVTWRDGTRSCITVDLAADSPADLVEMETAARSWADARPADRTVVTANSGSNPVISVTGCAG